MSWREPGPACQLRGIGETGDVAYNGHKDRGEDRADAGDGLGCPAPGIVGEARGGQGGDAVDVGSDVVDQPAEPIGPQPVHVVEAELFESRPPRKPDQVGHLNPGALVGQHSMNAGLERRADRDELGAAAGQLSQLTLRWRGDVGFGEATRRNKSTGR